MLVQRKGSEKGRRRTELCAAYMLISRDYLVEAAKQIHMALDSEVNEDYEAAFSYYKNGVDLLLNGVQLDPNKERREAVKRKTTQYLKRAEEIFITHLQDNLGKGSSHLTCH
uniref:MIT domain-containing protein n=1 Tax=Periophthalmus magnuspinnatus TaxID=409849 RepID=A0A3B4B4N1_9GOBI